MKIRERIELDEEDILSFLRAHKGDNVQVVSIDKYGRYLITHEHDSTESEFNMKVLHTFQNENIHGTLTTEEKNAIDYAIGAIKTLVDMGVLK